MNYLNENVVHEFKSLAKNIMQAVKVLENVSGIQTTTKKGKMSQIKKQGDDTKMLSVIQYTDNNGSIQFYQVKGYLSQRKSENRWMGRFRQLDKKEKCVYSKTKRECKEKLDRAIDLYCKLMNNTIKMSTPNKNSNTKENDVASSVDISKTMLLNTWFDYWVNTFKKPEVKGSTLKGYFDIYNRYTKDSLGLKRINEISSGDLQNHINNIGAYSGKKKTKQILTDCFFLLHQQGKIKINPMVAVVLPRENQDDAPIIKEEKEEIIMYKDEQTLIDYLSLGKKKNKYYYPVKLILYSGLRRGEMLGLQWKHIDFEKNEIEIIQQWNMDTKKITTTKQTSSDRIVPMLPEAREVLLELYNLNKDHKPKQDDYLFLSDCIGITQRLNKYGQVLGFRINPHMLRHTFASRCYASGVDPKRIQSLLGHKDIDTTLNTYVHVLEVEDKEIIQKMRNYFIEKGIIIILN